MVLRVERFRALPKKEQKFRHVRVSLLHAKISRMDLWFAGLPPITLLVLISLFFLDGEMYYMSLITSWVLLLVLSGYVYYRRHLISKVSRYLDPDVPVVPD